MYYFRPVFTFKGKDDERLSKYQRQLLIKEFIGSLNFSRIFYRASNEVI